MGQTALRRINPLRAVTAWKRSGAPASDLLPVVFLGFLSNAFLAIGVLLHLSRRQPTPKLDPTKTTLVKNESTPSQKNVIDNYNSEGKNYDHIRYGRTRGGRFFSEVELKETLLMMKAGNVLHVGTATGRVSADLVSKGFDYVGLELSNVMARITKEKLSGSAHLVQADAEHLPFKKNTFDNVVSVRSFHFMPDPGRFLRDANMVLKPSGRIIVSFEKKVRGREAFRKIMNLPPSKAKRIYYSNGQAVHLMQNAGFSTLHVGNVTKLPLLAYWRTNHEKTLRRIHPRIPSFFGTVGVVVGSKGAD